MTRLEVRPRHPEVKRLRDEISAQLGFDLPGLERVMCYSIHAPLSDDERQLIGSHVLCDPIAEELVSSSVVHTTYDWCVEVGYKAGVTDNVGRTAQTAIEDALGRSLGSGQRVSSSTKYLLAGKLDAEAVAEIAEGWLANRLINTVRVEPLRKRLAESIFLPDDDRELRQLSRDRMLALSSCELRAIRNYYANPQTGCRRTELGLPTDPTDVELEALAQTWSEHCKHKIFNARISYQEGETTEEINSLFKTYIRGATEAVAQQADWLISVFTDNAGVVRFDDEYSLACKVETHNSPSALDPFGGALTGILGVNRDIMGTGVGARLLANTDVFCFASPKCEKVLPDGFLHPRRILNGVRQGVEEGGNKSGVPTVNGCLVFDDRYLGKPLVYCGSVGIMPTEVRGTPAHLKAIAPGDRIVVAGGGTGKDGIHGATFSSEELNEQSPLSAVQIGDPFTQKKLHDFLLEARDLGLYTSLTDNGAGGLSSSVGESALISGGAELDLALVPLKYPGLLPWEILVSESQERMTLAVPPENWEVLHALAALHEVAIADIGCYTDSGVFHVLYGETTVGYLSLDFLHDGVPQLEINAEWRAPAAQPPLNQTEGTHAERLYALLARPNICSKESIIRQYDHEVQGGTVIKPLCGPLGDAPSDAAVVWPIEARRKGSYRGVVISNGLCPRYSDGDTFAMAQCAVDEAIRNAVATGADPSQLSLLDNFCWPDPLGDVYKSAQLVRACKGLYEAVVAFGAPLISGKDSMKNDALLGGVKISVPPTLLVTALSTMTDIRLAVSSEVKQVGDRIFMLGMTEEALRCSEYMTMLASPQTGVLPVVDLLVAPELYSRLHQAIRNRWVASCHDCSDGGFAVALAETAFGGGFGVEVDPYTIPCATNISEEGLLFGESPSRLIVTVPPKHSAAFSELFEGLPCAEIGVVTAAPVVNVTDLFCAPLDELKAAWQRTSL